jgi:ATP-dependent exoDNAse (exonuclease V) beta subunit
LRIGKKGSSANRVLALLVGHPDFGQGHHPWTFGDLAQWADCMAAHGILKDGTKERFLQCDRVQAATVGRLDEVFETGALTLLMDAFKGDQRALLNWWRRLMTADVRSRFQFPLDVATAHGSRALMDPPQVIVGTIHSVKGGQADVVYLFPDLSQAGDAQYQRNGESRDSVIRVFYVGATRARETLYICQRESLMAFSI